MNNKTNESVFYSSSRGRSDRAGSPRTTPQNSNIREALKDKFLAISFDGENILKAVVCGVLLVFFSLIQTTLMARVRPFGSIPDLILPLVCAVAITEKEKWGAVFGIIAAFVIESLGGSTVTILPLLYMPVGYLCGILSTYYFRDSITVRLMYIISTSLFRGIFTLIVTMSTIGGINFLDALKLAVLPELLCNILFGLIPHYLTKLCLRPFNKTRAEKVV